ncbi:Ppx/GppA family phosphatase [Granulibacter bethesdensis]|uniref:Ppx/GppA family phosphatase n=1 Tax=Granulibacter bethesdensis TaxID=364410 RepID=UPI0009096DAA|nr:Ppx/GppA family phosphatase [Granulibacter bethesdensis]APH58501.1 Exopolyphosphatase [Granulibacter bethesdensis]
MLLPLPTDRKRAAVVDLGSNSVRLVVFEGQSRNPLPIFNEKAVLRLGRGLQTTGRLNDEGVGQALVVMARYYALARAMHADPFEVLATAAVRDAENGPDFVAALERIMPGVPILVLSGHEEAALSAQGVLCGMPQARGILADIGGGSLEVVRLDGGQAQDAATLRLGVIRLADRAGGDPAKARTLVDTDLASVPWLGQEPGQDLLLVGGAWRAMARIHMAQTGYPLNMVHHYTISRDEARDLTGVIASASPKGLERLPAVPRRRMEDLPYAALVLRRLLRTTGCRRVVFSANGLREGWYMRTIPPEIAARDPLRAVAEEDARLYSRDPALPGRLCAWTDGLFPDETEEQRRLREACCLMSDIGHHDHPEFRAEQAFHYLLRQPGSGLDHHGRAFLGLTIAMRYEADPASPWLLPARLLLDSAAALRADILGHALRLAYTLSGGTPALLALAGLNARDGALELRLHRGGGVFAGESVVRRLEQLAQIMGLRPMITEG